MIFHIVFYLILLLLQGYRSYHLKISDPELLLHYNFLINLLLMFVQIETLLHLYLSDTDELIINPKYTSGTFEEEKAIQQYIRQSYRKL